MYAGGTVNRTNHGGFARAGKAAALCETRGSGRSLYFHGLANFHAATGLQDRAALGQRGRRVLIGRLDDGIARRLVDPLALLRHTNLAGTLHRRLW